MEQITVLPWSSSWWVPADLDVDQYSPNKQAQEGAEIWKGDGQYALIVEEKYPGRTTKCGLE